MTTVAALTSIAAAMTAIAAITTRTVAAIGGSRPIAARRGLGGRLRLTLVGLGRPHRGDERLRQWTQSGQGRVVVGEGPEQRRLGLQSAWRLPPSDQVADQFDGLLKALQVIARQRFDPGHPEIGQPPFQERRGQTAAGAGKDVEDGAGPALGGRVGHGAGSVGPFRRYQPEMTRWRYRVAKPLRPLPRVGRFGLARSR